MQYRLEVEFSRPEFSSEMGGWRWVCSLFMENGSAVLGCLSTENISRMEWSKRSANCGYGWDLLKISSIFWNLFAGWIFPGIIWSLILVNCDLYEPWQSHQSDIFFNIHATEPEPDGTIQTPCLCICVQVVGSYESRSHPLVNCSNWSLSACLPQLHPHHGKAQLADQKQLKRNRRYSKKMIRHQKESAQQFLLNNGSMTSRW